MDQAEERFNIVYYVTGHGLGHLSRSLEIIRHLVEAGHSVTVVTGAPVHVFAKDLPTEHLTVRHAILDSGAKQKDAFTVDQQGSLKEYVATAGGHKRAEIIVEEAEWLRNSGAELVVSDIVPLACVAAAAASIPCVAVSNFSWDFIYSEYLTAAGSAFRDLIWQIADDYACALKLLRLPGYVPMPAFREVLDVPLVVRHAKHTREQVRQSLGISNDSKLACFIYGGQPPGSNWKLEESCLPPGWLCLVCSAGKPPGSGPLPPNFILAPEDAYTPDLIEACDVVLGKIGYGTTSECLAHNRPLVFLRRDFFNEEPFLRRLLEIHDAAVEMKRRDFLSGNWAPYLERAVALKPCYSEPTNGAEIVAAELIQTVRDFRFSGGHLPGMLSFSTNSMDAAAASTSPASTKPELFLTTPPRPGSAGGGVSTPQHPGQSRLRDTIAWGYMMGRHASRELSLHPEVPEWYTRGQIPWETAAGGGGGGASAAQLSSPISTAAAGSPGVDLSAVESLFDIVQPDGPSSIPELGQFPDTLRFLSLIGSLEDHEPVSAELSAVPSTSTDAAKHGKSASFDRENLVLPELRAAAGLFLKDEPIFVTRAPGRLDVMGGIADYSGSLVLQMPISEAAHVALQLQKPRHQRLWRHMQARHAAMTSPAAADAAAAGSKVIQPGPTPALRIVSLNADATNRGPAFDMDISELIDENGEPVTYAAAREYFQRDPALSWAAYIAGGLVILMREKGVRPEEGIAMLVSSEVPDGKGVSSSAAVEVAAMQALAAAHGVELEGRELALLCQKVENLVVGAPCGVMDQMASALGEAGWLLALRCQPAEIEGAVQIPLHARFWGIDSGIRHSVGGSDYGAVRSGAFMGLKILSKATSTASEELKILGGGYLANIAPSNFARRLEKRLPETLTGAEFLEKYGSHLDTVTHIDPEKTYAVKVPTAHPVFENFRVAAFRQTLAAQGTPKRQQLEVLAELMMQSHVSYSKCGLGSEGTDRLVALVQEERNSAEEAGREPALYGAKITGGGCGGTVCILGTADEAGEAALKRVAERYEAETGHSPQIFKGTSPGAVEFGVVCVQRKLAEI